MLKWILIALALFILFILVEEISQWLWRRYMGNPPAADEKDERPKRKLAARLGRSKNETGERPTKKSASG